MDSIENSLKIAQQYETLASSSQTQLMNDDLNAEKFSNLLKLYEYQIVEMQHEYELLLEDKIIVDKLLDNQMRIFSKYQNLSNEKTLIQQFNALNQEMDLLQLQLSKVNQLLNDTIAEKCKQELIYQQQNYQQIQQQQKSIYHQQQQQQQQQSSHQPLRNNPNIKSDSSSLFRASLVPVGTNSTTSVSAAAAEPTSKTVPSIWKTNSPMFTHKKLNTNNHINHFNSNENLNSQDAKDFCNNIVNGSNSYKSSNGELNQDQSKPNSFHQHHHYYYVNNNNNNNTNGGNLQGSHSNTNSGSINSKLDTNSMSKSIDSIYSPPASCSTVGSNGKTGVTLNGGIGNGNGAFNQPIKKVQHTDMNEDSHGSSSFQPINFTNNRPKQITVVHQPAQPQPSFQQANTFQQTQTFVPKASNFKRDIIAEKKRSSIGKYPHNQNVYNCLF
jgi:hypothetical protein